MAQEPINGDQLIVLSQIQPKQQQSSNKTKTNYTDSLLMSSNITTRSRYCLLPDQHYMGIKEKRTFGGVGLLDSFTIWLCSNTDSLISHKHILIFKPALSRIKPYRL
jgi:hypothetical protein